MLHACKTESQIFKSASHLAMRHSLFRTLFLDHAETGEKGQNVISSSVQHLISFIFAIHVSFIIPLPMTRILLTKPRGRNL